MKGKKFLDVEKRLLENGFLPENISFEKVERQKKGFFNREGETLAVIINGSESLPKGAIIKKDSFVLIKYATYGYHTIK